MCIRDRYNSWGYQRIEGGTASLQLVIKQPISGSGLITWPASVKWAGGTAPTLSVGSSKVDIVSFLYDRSSSIYYATFSGNFS